MASSPHAVPQPNPPDDVGFNPYLKWLGIRGGSAPYDHYAILGLSAFEEDLDVIASAADRQMAHVRTYQSGEYAETSQQVLNELAKAKVTLLKPDRKAQYDAQLRRETQAVPVAAVRASPAPPSPVGPVVANPPTAVRVSPTPSSPVRPVGASPGPSIVITPQEPRSSGTSHAASRSRKQQSPTMWIVLGIASFALLVLIVVAANKRPDDRSGNSGSGTSRDSVANVNTHSNRNSNSNNRVNNGNHSNHTNRPPQFPNQERLTPEEIERAELEAARARVLEAARRAEEREREAAAAAEAEATAEVSRTALNRNAWVKYQDLRIRYSGSSVDELLDPAQSEQDPATRAGIAFVAIERAVETGELNCMKQAVGILTSPSAVNGYIGMFPYDALKGQENILTRGAISNFEPSERLSLMRDMIKKTWLAYEHGDYALAERLLALATDSSEGLAPSGVANGSSQEERTEASRKLTAARRALLDAKQRTERFAGLSEAAGNGSALSAALLDIEQDGDWAGAIEFLVHSDIAELASAAHLDEATPESPTDLLSAANAWRAAATSDSENENHWYSRSSALLAKAENAASRQSLGGTAVLEFNNAAAELSSVLLIAGVSLDSLAGHQGYVDNDDGLDADGPLTEIGGITNPGLEGRTRTSRSRLLREGGGTSRSESAVAAALAWIANHQSSDGSWDFDHQLGPCRGQCGNPGNLAGNAKLGATAMALLPFLGAGETHLEGNYKETVRAGLDYLVSHTSLGRESSSFSRQHGSLMDEGTMYSHGLATIALCEAYGMTQDRRYEQPAQLAINYIVYAQDPVGGGWRYQPKSTGDTSVFGWQLVALKCAHMADLTVPVETIRGAATYLDSAASGENGSRFGYLGSGSGRTTTSIGLLCRMYIGCNHEHPGLVDGVEYLSRIGPSPDDMSYNYFTTQVMRHYGGEEWMKWNGVMRDQLINSQETEGHAQGSWYQGGEQGAARGGRLYVTSLSTMILEVYYRHLPIYSR